MARVLNLPQIGRHDSFFDLGGDSLLALSAVARLSEQFGKELPIREFFDNPTVSRLAATILTLASGTSKFEHVLLEKD